MICINKNCQACKDHFVKQVVYKECYNDKEFITDCETHEKFEGLTKTKKSRVREGDEER